jgi:hypothetical protein
VPVAHELILATQEADIMIQSQPGQIVLETLSWKKPFKKKRAGGVARGVDPEFKSQYRKKKKNPSC